MPTIGAIVEFLQAQGAVRTLVDKALGIEIAGVAGIEEAGPGRLSFMRAKTKDPARLLSGTRASMLLIDRSVPVDEAALRDSGVAAIVVSSNARLDFIRVVTRYFSPPRPTGIHPTAVIHPTAKIGKDVFIGPLCSVAEGAEIGDGSTVHAGVHVYWGVKIGKNVTVYSGAVIGADGFGHERTEDGTLAKFPHLGDVVIEDDVEIGSNTCVDRGTLSETRICTGARLDNLIQVGHNVRVGRHAVITADVMIGAGTRIGDYAWIAPSACLRERLTIGARAMVGQGALVTKSVPDGATVLGSPARQQSDHRLLMTHLSDMIEAKKPKEG